MPRSASRRRKLDLSSLCPSNYAHRFSSSVRVKRSGRKPAGRSTSTSKLRASMPRYIRGVGVLAFFRKRIPAGPSRAELSFVQPGHDASLVYRRVSSPELVDQAIAAGHVESTCARDRGLLGKKDWDIARYVVEHNFALVTHNARDFRGPGQAAPGGSICSGSSEFRRVGATSLLALLGDFLPLNRLTGERRVVKASNQDGHRC